MTQYDVVIIGGGAAGLSAALVLSRARRRVLVVDGGAPRNAPAAQLHDTDADGWVTVDNTGRTSVSGVWAAGNVVDPRAQVITAAGAGSAAAIALNADLVDDDVRAAVRDLDHGLLLASAHPTPSP